jgi:hypothetical protein
MNLWTWKSYIVTGITLAFEDDGLKPIIIKSNGPLGRGYGAHESPVLTILTDESTNFIVHHKRCCSVVYAMLRWECYDFHSDFGNKVLRLFSLIGLNWLFHWSMPTLAISRLYRGMNFFFNWRHLEIRHRDHPSFWMPIIIKSNGPLGY